MILHLIFAFCEAPECANIFQTEWDIKNGFGGYIAKRDKNGLDNWKNGWKAVCVYKYQNGDAKFSSFGALGRQCVSIPKKMSNKNTYLSSYWVEGKRKDLTDDNMSAVLKFATTSTKIPFKDR